MTAFLLRTAEESDLDAVMAIETSVFANDAWSRDGMSGELAARDTWYVVAVPDDDRDHVVGYAGILAGYRTGDADVQTVAVAPEARGRGLGRTLVTELVAHARRRGAREVFLEVRADNPVAQGLYRSLGFEEVGVRPRYYMPDGVDALMMRLIVPPAETVPAAGATDAEAPTGTVPAGPASAGLAPAGPAPAPAAADPDPATTHDPEERP